MSATRSGAVGLVGAVFMAPLWQQRCVSARKVDNGRVNRGKGNVSGGGGRGGERAGGRGGVNLPALRGHNEALLLDLLRSAGAPGLGRAELAARTGLTPQAVSKITARLAAEGLVAEAGRGASTGGKPRTLLRLVPQARHGVGSTWTATGSGRYGSTSRAASSTSGADRWTSGRARTWWWRRSWRRSYGSARADRPRRRSGSGWPRPGRWTGGAGSWDR